MSMAEARERACMGGGGSDLIFDGLLCAICIVGEPPPGEYCSFARCSSSTLLPTAC